MEFYNVINWIARSVQFPYRRTVKHEDGSIERVEIMIGPGDPGEIDQEGTPLSATNLNTMEGGILHGIILNALHSSVLKDQVQQVDDVKGEKIDITLKCPNKYPFAGTPYVIQFAEKKNNLKYQLGYEVLNAVGGTVDDVKFTSKALNGVTATAYGSASSADIRVFVKGGIY